MWSISALLASCLTTWKAIFQPTKVGCHLGPGHLPFKGSAQAVPSACDLRPFLPISYALANIHLSRLDSNITFSVKLF